MLGLMATAGVTYLSVIPLKYQPMNWQQTWDEFQGTPWLELGLENRADWVANGLMLIPSGFFLSGSLLGRSKSLGRLLFALVLAGIFFFGLVVVIEFTQIWFPPRVVSQNDMFAGFVGGLLGVCAWRTFGPAAIDWIVASLSASATRERLAFLAQLFAIGILLFHCMPLDVLLSSSEWAIKWSTKVSLVPFADVEGLTTLAKKVVLNLWALALGSCYGLLLHRATASKRVIAWCVVVELATIPIFHRTTSATDLVLTISLGLIGVWSARQTGSILKQLNRQWCWLFFSLAFSLLLLVAFLIRYERVVVDAAEWQDRLDSFFAVPFARMQRSTEFQALENVLGKLLIFAALSFLVSGWLPRLPGKSTIQWLLPLAWAMVLGVMVELGQVFLVPLVPDISDLIIYGVGAALGILFFRWLTPTDFTSMANAGCMKQEVK